MGKSGSPFFHDYQTKLTIDAICEHEAITVYAGAGVTIDKSGLDWLTMIFELSRPVVSGNDGDVRKLLESLGPLPAASAVHSQYLRTSDGSRQARERIASRLRDTMYAKGTWQTGQLAQAIVDFAYYWQATDQAVRSIAVVTTNYDDYIFREMTVATENDDVLPQKPFELKFPAIADPLMYGDLHDSAPELSNWVTTGEYPKPGVIPCVHLHGRVPGRSDDEHSQFPVVSEADYQVVSGIASKALESMMRKSAFVFVGASLSDPPLLRALWSTRNCGQKRWALVKKPNVDGNTESLLSIKARDLESARLEIFGVEPIYYDYHVQAPQFFRELTTNLVFKDELTTYSSENNKWRYGKRLCRWSDEWHDLTTPAGYNLRQRESHEVLAAALGVVHDVLGAPESEQIKLEVWLRWRPERHRKLRLWCSSTGPWLDISMLVDADIDEDEKYTCTEAFRSGRPAHRHVGGSRWKQFVSVPIWHLDREYGARMIVGAVTVASSGRGGHNSLDPARNSARLQELFSTLQFIGISVAEPDPQEVANAKASFG